VGGATFELDSQRRIQKSYRWAPRGWARACSAAPFSGGSALFKARTAGFARRISATGVRGSVFHAAVTGLRRRGYARRQGYVVEFVARRNSRPAQSDFTGAVARRGRGWQLHAAVRTQSLGAGLGSGLYCPPSPIFILGAPGQAPHQPAPRLAHHRTGRRRWFAGGHDLRRRKFGRLFPATKALLAGL
jgi:hypothetical protein